MYENTNNNKILPVKKAVFIVICGCGRICSRIQHVAWQLLKPDRDLQHHEDIDTWVSAFAYGGFA